MHNYIRLIIRIHPHMQRLKSYKNSTKNALFETPKMMQFFSVPKPDLGAVFETLIVGRVLELTLSSYSHDFLSTLNSLKNGRF